MKSKEKYSKASKTRWAKYTPEERSKKMSDLVKKRWSKMTKEELSEHGKKLQSAKRPSMQSRKP